MEYTRVVDDHVIELDASELVLFRNPAEGVEEQTVTKLHDVRLVYASDFLRGTHQGMNIWVGSQGVVPCGHS